MSPTLRSRIQELHAAGSSPPEISRKLGVAPATVAYHLRRLADAAAGSGAQPPGERPAASQRTGAVSQISTRQAVAALLDAGMTKAQIAKALELSKATITYHVRRLAGDIDERCARRYDWSQIQAYYDEGHSVRECLREFGFSSASWFDAVKRGAIVARPARMPLTDLLQPDTYRGRYHLKLRLLEEGLKENRCEECGLTDWRGEPITLALHHVNGVRNDNRLENLQLLCPNCHSQTDTFAGRNGRVLADGGGTRWEPPVATDACSPAADGTR